MNRSKFIHALFQIDAIKFGDFRLKSGIVSPIYLDLRLLISFPNLLKEAASLMWEQIASLDFTLLCGVPYTALPIATAISLMQDIPMVMRRKESKDHGTKQLIEGRIIEGQKCLIIEDLISSGSSIIETAVSLQNRGLAINDACVLIDRGQGGRAALEEQGIDLHAAFTLEEILHTLNIEGLLGDEKVRVIGEFLQANQFMAPKR